MSTLRGSVQYVNGFVILKSNDRETINKYIEKLNFIKSTIVCEKLDKLKELATEHVKNKDVTNIKFEKLYVENEKIEIKLEKHIYENYKNDIDEILKKEILMTEDGYVITSIMKVEFEVSTF